MKRRIILGSLGLLGLCSAAVPAQAAANLQNNWYFGFSGDLTWLRHSNMGGGGNIDLGYQFSDFRLEGEAGYHGAGGDGGYSSTHYFTYMGNLYYDFNRAGAVSSAGWHVLPYLGAGLGDAAVHYGSGGVANTFHHHTNNFAYEGMTGLNFVSASMPTTDWNLGYRYLGTDSPNLNSNNLELGVRFHF